MQTSSKPSMLILGAPPRSGNHLLRGLLDHHPQLLLPPAEDFFVRHLSREPLSRWRGMLTSRAGIEDFFRQLQKEGHLERVNAGNGKQVFGSEDSLDLEAYYDYVRTHHRRGSVNRLVRNHVEALAVALGHTEGDRRQHVCFSPLQPSNRDLTRVSKLLARSYAVKGIFLARDPRAQLASNLVRNPTLDLGRFCQRQNSFRQEIDWFIENCGPALLLRFEDLVTDTETCMREVCKFAGIAFSPSVLEYTQGGKASQGNSSFAVSTGIDRSVLTRYRESLPTETIAYLEQHCMPDLFWHAPPELDAPAQQGA
jgi:hypothetical protein